MSVITTAPDTMSYTAQDIITRAMRLLNLLGSGETPTASEASDSLTALQGMVDTWNTERLMIFTIPRLVFSLTPGQQTYNLGANPPNAWDFNYPRPARIERMGIIWLGNAEQPLELPMQYLTVAQWQEIPVKNISSSLPQYCWDDNGYPFRGLNFWPIPNTNDQVTIYPWSAVTLPTTLTSLIAFPPAYYQAFVYNLAVMLASEFPVVPPEILQTVMSIASQTKALIKSLNMPMVDLRCDPALTPLGDRYLYNWISDMPAGR
jgi:hypothetical protein